MPLGQSFDKSFSTTADYIIGKNSVNEPAGVPLTSFWIIIKAIGIGAVVGVLFAAIPCRKIVFKPLLTVQTSSSISENVPSGIQVENAATTAGWRDREDVKTMDALKSTQKNGSVDEHFNFFKSRFARVYSSSKEEIRRKKLFEGNLNIINAMNKQHPLAFFAVNHYADYSEGEKQMLKMNRNPIENLRKAFYGITPSTTSIFSASSTGWLQANDCAGCELYPDLINITIDNMPKSIDWRNLGAVTNVKKQQIISPFRLILHHLQQSCGSCWAFSSIADIEGQNFLARGVLESFSEQQIVSCDVNSYEHVDCNGGLPYFALQYVKTFGGVLGESSYPYEIVPSPSNNASDCKTSAIDLNNMSLGDLGHVGRVDIVSMSADTEEFVALALAKNGPLSIVLNAIGMEYYVRGIVGCKNVADAEYCSAAEIDNPANCDANTIDHAVAAVGFGSQNGTDYWLIKNSWGPDWGEQGYYRLEKGHNTCGVANMVVHSAYYAR